MTCIWRSLPLLALAWAGPAAAQGVREAGVQALVTTASPALVTGGLYAAVRPSLRTRIAVTLGAGVSDGRAAGRGELLQRFVAALGDSCLTVNGIITPVKVATPDAEGVLYHKVETGQSLWSIAIAYKVTIKDLQTWNNLPSGTMIKPGQRLFIPTGRTAGYSTPTPVGMIVPSTPDADGKIIHTVQPYNNLITIAGAYKVSVDTVLSLNAWKIDWPLQVGQKLIIYPGNVTPTPTPRPLTPIENRLRVPIRAGEKVFGEHV